MTILVFSSQAFSLSAWFLPPAQGSFPPYRRAKPTFARVAAQIRRTSSANVVVITGSARHADEVAYTRDLGLEESQLVSLNFNGLRLRVVPTLVLVDGHGQVHYSSEGVISSAQQEDLLRTVTSLAALR